MSISLGQPRQEPLSPIHRGSNQSGMRAFNERLVLSLVRRHGAIAKSDLARLTGLSAQTVSVIMRSLETDRLILRGKPVRGKVGQPSVPLSLNPDGAYFLGLKIGRRSADFVLADFLGAIRMAAHEAYAWPDPDAITAFVARSANHAAGLLGDNAGRIAGLGVAMPFELWNWAEEVGAPQSEMDRWRDFDIREAIAAQVPWPVYLQNDASAACGAELAFGPHGNLQDFVYFYIGTFAGGGIVLNGSLYTGRFGNAGALGSMPVPDRTGRTVQLIDIASLVVLERRLKSAGIDPSPLWSTEADWSGFRDHAQDWIEGAARGLAYAVAACASVIDFEAALIDGSLPAEIREQLVRATAREMGRLDLQGIAAPQLRAGTIGSIARAIGGASLPLFDKFLIDQNMLMREH